VFANRRIVPYRNHFRWAIPIFQIIKKEEYANIPPELLARAHDI
jgi:hypothetical protein